MEAKIARTQGLRVPNLYRESVGSSIRDCGQTYPTYVMDFDHRDPTTKLCKVSAAVYLGSEQKLLDEIAKCDLVCANCHRVRTHGSLK